MKKIYLLIPLLALSVFQTNAQVDLCLPVATGKGGAATALVKDWQAIGINPSNLGWDDNYKFSISILNAGISAQSKALDFNALQNVLTNPSKKFTLQDKQHYADVFSTKDGLNLHSDINWLAASFYMPKIGGFAVNLRDRISGHVTLNKKAADILFMGSQSPEYQNPNIVNEHISSVIDGTNISFYSYRELNLSYGRQLFSFNPDDSLKGVRVFGGVGVKYLWGLGDAEAKAENGTFTAHSSISTAYKINYGQIQNFTPQTVSNIFNATGSGVGLDLGASIKIGQNLRFGVAATDLGKINWSNNLLTAADTTMTPLDSTETGLNSWNLGSQSSFLFGKNGFIHMKPGPDYSIPLASKLRMGVGFKVDKRIQLGADVVLPMNNAIGNLTSPYYAVGGELDVFKSFKISSGFAGNNTYGFNVPFGITFSAARVVEFYLATDDVLTFFGKNSNPFISGAFGLLRFNIK